MWRAGQVRNCWVTQDRESAGFWDAAVWEEVKRKGEGAIEKWIDDQLKGMSVTAVLIGAETAERKYVGYEIKQSHSRDNGMLGIYIHNMKDSNGYTDSKGKNPFDSWSIQQNGRTVVLSMAGFRGEGGVWKRCYSAGGCRCSITRSIFFSIFSRWGHDAALHVLRQSSCQRGA